MLLSSGLLMRHEGVRYQISDSNICCDSQDALSRVEDYPRSSAPMPMIESGPEMLLSSGLLVRHKGARYQIPDSNICCDPQDALFRVENSSWEGHDALAARLLCRCCKVVLRAFASQDHTCATRGRWIKYLIATHVTVPKTPSPG